MINTANFLKSKQGQRLPKKISKKLRTIKRIDKVFSKIGLKDHLQDKAVSVRIGDNKYAKWQIGFTTKPWDLATMSMRGATSCMNWQSEHSYQLVGSIVDPCTAMVYLTDGKKTKHGVAIKRRSLVRFAIDSKTNKPFITVDKVYADTGCKDPYNYYDNHDTYSRHTKRLFMKHLRTLVDIDVRDPDDCRSSCYIPEAPVVGKLSYTYMSCVDHGVDYDLTRDGYKQLKKLGVPVSKKTMESAAIEQDDIW